MVRELYKSIHADNETDDFANDKEIRRQRAERARHLQMVKNSLKLISMKEAERFVKLAKTIAEVL